MQKKNKYIRILRTNFQEANNNHGIDFYHRTLELSMMTFIGIFVLLFLGANAFFGFLYYLQPGSILGVSEHTFLNCFFFSVQTMGTIGYGAFSPHTVYAHALATIEVMIGLVGLGIFAALTFARISLPRGLLKFSEQCVVNEDDDVPKLMFKVVHLRKNMVMNVRITLQLLFPVVNKYGQTEMQLKDLELENNQYHAMTAAWLVKHKMTASSPLFNKSAEDFVIENYSLIATVTGVDSTISQNVNHVYSYLPEDVLWGKRFKSMIQFDTISNEYIIDLDLVDTIEDAFVKEGLFKKYFTGLTKRI